MLYICPFPRFLKLIFSDQDYLSGQAVRRDLDFVVVPHNPESSQSHVFPEIYVVSEENSVNRFPVNRSTAARILFCQWWDEFLHVHPAVLVELFPYLTLG